VAATPAAPSPYWKWLNEDVPYIITDDERYAFKRLTTDEERNHFIEQFWLRRDPKHSTAENEFKLEHYRRIAYANEPSRPPSFWDGRVTAAGFTSLGDRRMKSTPIHPAESMNGLQKRVAVSLPHSPSNSGATGT
jgi:GWxTD domain-containing protein